MKPSNVSTLLRTQAALVGVGLLVMSYGVARVDIQVARAAGTQKSGPATPVAASARPAVGAPIAVFVGFQVVIPSTEVVRYRLEPADGSIAMLRQAHQVPLLILLGVAKGQARLVLEYAGGHTEERTLEVRTGSPPGTETLRLRVGQVHTGHAATHLKSFSAATSGMVDVKVAPSGQDYLIRAVKPGTSSVILIQDDSSIEQKLVEIVP